MNNSDSYAGHAQRIGLIELPELAEALIGFGLQVVTAPDFRGGVAAVKEGFATYGAFPVIVTDKPIAGLRAWVERIQTVAQIPVAVIREGGEPSIVSENVTEVLLPSTVNAILAAVGLPPVNGADTAFPAAAPAPVGVELPDFDFDFAEPAAPAQVAPVAVQAPAPVVAPAPQAPAADLFGLATPAAQVEDPFADDPFAAPATGQGTRGGFAFTPAAPEEDADFAAATPSAPAPAADLGWDTVAAQTPVQAAPVFDAPVFEAPVQPAPVAELGWDTVAAETPVQAAPAMQPWQAPADQQVPLQPAPVAQQGWDAVPVQQAPAADFAWDTQAPAPAAPAPVPVQQAPSFSPAPPAAPATAGWDAPAVVPPAFGGPADAASVFDSFEAAKLHGTGRSAAGMASMIISWSGKGGVGKTTTALQLATLCAEAGLRTVLIDGNSGQGDLRTYLRLNRSDLPTIYNAAIGSIASAVLSPTAINAVPARQGLGEIKFGFVAAPPEDIEDGEIVTNATYRAVIDYCRKNADVVILDTQIIEAIDRTRVLSELLVPAMVQDAWGIGVADMTPVGVNNLNARLRKLASMGVAPDRQMIFVNKVPEVQVSDAAKLNAHFAGRATFLGSVTEDPAIRDAMNAGRTEVTNAQMRASLSAALLRVTGNEEFRGMTGAPAAAAAPVKPAKVGFWGRMTGKKAAA